MRRYHRKKAECKSIYSCDPWRITEESFKVNNYHHNEAIFALGNGYMGARGVLEEDYNGPADTTTPGVYINGVYESEEIIYGEDYPYAPKKSQTIVNLANWMKINLYVDGEKLDLLEGNVSDYKRFLDMKRGVLSREFVWKSTEGKKIAVNIHRFLSLTSLHCGLISYDLTPLNFTGQVRLVSEIDGDVQNYHFLRKKNVLKDTTRGFTEGYGYLCQQTQNTEIMIGVIMDNQLFYPENTLYQEKRYTEDKSICHEFEIDVKEGYKYRMEKYVSLYSSLEVQKDLLLDKLKKEVKRAVDIGWAKMLQEHKDYLQDYWQDVDVRIYGDDSLQQGFRFNAYHLLQAAGRNGITNVPAKGLTGEFYEGHYFWDTEIYVVPFFLYSKPSIARRLLMFRYNKLDNARQNARRLKLNGALYPWRTLNGDEASGFFMGSTIQYHIDADIAYAVWLYCNVTQDYEFLFHYGVEILVETARMWASRGSFIAAKDNKFCLNVVCGPDEYQPGANNNCYTNYMAKFNLEYALAVVRLMEEKEPEKYKEFKAKLNLEENELYNWKQAAQAMYLPYSEEMEINPQDDSFLYKEPIYVDEIPEDEIPLVKNWHPLTIWRFQVIKQADVILLMLLLSDQFTTRQKKNNYDFYEPKTTHDSSLSPAIYSIIASEIGYKDEAYNYFMQTVRLDLDDYNNNAYQGVHTACMAGSWLALVQGFAGMRVKDGTLHFAPYVPDKWDGYEFKLKFKKRQLQIRVTADGCKYNLLRGEPLRIYHKGNEKIVK